MTRFLLPAARSPVTLDLARNLHRFGHEVVVVDSWRFAITKKSSCIKTFCYLPEMRCNLENYKQELIKIVQEYQIDMIIPVYEEIFYLAAIKKDLQKYCQVFTEDLSVLRPMHSKFDIMNLLQGCSINTLISNKL